MFHSYRICCVCGGFGFPIGTASTKRVTLIGRALISTGIPFHVWHLGSSSYSENKQKRGEQNGITWEYLSPSLKRPANILLRAFYFLYGCLQLLFRLVRFRNEICVYLYYQGDIINLWVLLVCRLLSIPVAQECCEWWPGTPYETFFNRWMYHHVMFHLSTGALPISTLIEQRIRKVARKEYPILRVPVLVDSDEIHQEFNHTPQTLGTSHPYIFWCGMVDGYIRDPLFLIRTLGEINHRHKNLVRLVLAGPCNDETRAELMRAATAAGLTPKQVIITGFIPENELFRLATHAKVMLLPLWDDDRSKSRFPTKMGLYLAASHPIVTCAIGEINQFLCDKETALFAEPDNASSWAYAIISLIKNQDLYSHIQIRMQTDVLPRVDYRGASSALKAFFFDCMINHE